MYFLLWMLFWKKYTGLLQQYLFYSYCYRFTTTYDWVQHHKKNQVEPVLTESELTLFLSFSLPEETFLIYYQFINLISKLIFSLDLIQNNCLKTYIWSRILSRINCFWKNCFFSETKCCWFYYVYLNTPKFKSSIWWISDSWRSFKVIMGVTE